MKTFFLICCLLPLVSYSWAAALTANDGNVDSIPDGSNARDGTDDKLIMNIVSTNANADLKENDGSKEFEELKESILNEISEMIQSISFKRVDDTEQASLPDGSAPRDAFDDISHIHEGMAPIPYESFAIDFAIADHPIPDIFIANDALKIEDDHQHLVAENN